MSEEPDKIENGHEDVDVPVSESDTKNEEDNLKDEIRKFTLSVSDSSVHNQLMFFGSLVRAIDRTEALPEPYIKGLIKILLTTSARRYSQPKSFQLAWKLLNALAKHDSVAAVRHMAHTLATTTPIIPNIGEGVALSMVPPSKWLLALLHHAASNQADFNAAVSTLSSLAFYILHSKKASVVFTRKLKQALGRVPLEKFEAAITELSKEASNAEKLLCLISFLTRATEKEVLGSAFVDLFAKATLLPKTRPLQVVVECCAQRLSKLDKKQFDDSLLPSIKKALLRSPEVAMYGVNVALQNASFPLDAYADDIMKAIAASLTSSDESLQLEAVKVAVALTNSAEAATIGKIINRLFDQISGAKTAEHRIALLNGVAACSNTKTPNSNSLDDVANNVISKTAKAEKDTHEGTVTAQWDAAAAWASRLTVVSPVLANAFKEVPKLAAVVRYVGYRDVGYTVIARKMESLPDGVEKIYSGEVEGAQKEILDLIGLSFVLLKTSPISSAEHQKVATKFIANENIFKDKLLTSIKWKDAVLWAELVELLLLENRDCKEQYPSILLRSLSLLLFWPKFEVRRRASAALTTVLKRDGALFAEALADVIYSETVNGFIDQTLRKLIQPADADWNVSGEHFVQILRLLLTPTGPELDKLAIHTLLMASLPRLVAVDGSVWLRWMHEHVMGKGWKPSQTFIDSAIDRVLKCKQRDVRDNSLITLVALNSPEVRATLWKHVEETVAEVDVKEYTKITEKQVAVFKCQEGHLYNTEVLVFDEGEFSHNTKRENKAYSYKEQLAEAQLRRELAEKKRKEGKLTAKQKQVMEKELASEKVIRDEMGSMYVAAEAKLDELRAMVAADHMGAFARSNILYDFCIPLTRSHLVSQEAALLFNAYREAAFPHSEDFLDELLSCCYLRAVGSKTFDEKWAGESQFENIRRALSLLNERAFVVDTGDDDGNDDGMMFDEIVGAPQLTFLYPLVKILLEGAYTDQIKEDTLQLLQNAIHRRFLKDGAVLQLPMVNFATLLLSYYSEHQAQAAHQTLVQLVGLANESEDAGERVVAMTTGALSYLTHTSQEVRESVLKVLSAPQLLTRLVLSSQNESFVLSCLVRIFVARFDSVESVAEVATQLWYSSIFHLKESMALPLIDECVSEYALIRTSASRAVAAFVEEFPQQMEIVLNKIDEVYKDLSEIRGAVFDEVGRMTKDTVDEWERRSGVGCTLTLLAELVQEAQAMQLIKIIVPLGLVDRNAAGREALCSAAVETIRRHGRSVLPILLPFLEELNDSVLSGAEHDNLRQGVVVLLGTLAQFLEPSSEKVRQLVSRLVASLSTPSQSVQESVSRCLAPLVPAIPDVPKLVSDLQFLLYNGSSYGERRGAAYGIAGLVKGMGMVAFKDLDLLTTIQSGLLEKKNPKMREGGLLALEILCGTVGKLFEPYMIQSLPSLLICFGDSDPNVRKAAQDTAKAMMSNMTAYGTKLVLPSLLTALDDESWRTKCAATELLGSMAFCAPRQLSSCLPSIVPKLIEVLADSSSKVQKSGENALRQIALVVRNPEILGVTNQLMIGLLDPANKTSLALQAVLNTKFIHYIDAPSLALLMPIVRRAFEDRNSETRRVAAQIIANIYNLTENKDMEPYLCDLVPGLQKSLLDPVPDIRSVAARALGAIVAKSSGATSERLRATIVPWLKEKLISVSSTVDRSGAAQGLCEVLAGCGSDQLEHVMPEIISATENPEVSAEVRDGYILMYIYLPMVFGEKFVPFLPRVVPPILKALADENEYVRASALKAGQRLIAQYCSHARRLLLPQLQLALVDDNWRIRHAAVQLIGDFLFNISGVSGKSTSSTANEDDTMGMEQAGKTIIRALGQQCRDRILGGLYLARSDVALIVRQAAGHVWKIVVANTPRTLKELMKTLFEMVVDSLASTCEERQQCGARCLGELVRKMGEKIINEILPVLEANQQSEDLEKRIGVAVALHEIIDNMSKEVLNHYLSSLVVPVRNAICDSEPAVRNAAADTFSVLYGAVGHEALDDIITPLLEKLTPDQDHILEGLCQVMKQNSRQMLPYLLPRLTKPPVNVHALCSLAAVAGDSLSRQLPRVLDALLASCVNNDQYDPMIDSCEKVVIAVTDEDGVPVLAEYLIKKASGGNVPSAVLLHTFVVKSGVTLNELADKILPGLLELYTSTNDQIVDHAIHAAIGIAQALDQKEMQDLIPVIKKTLNMMVAQAKGKLIPGFAHPKGLQPLLPMIRECILQGGVELKALAGETLGMMVGVAEPAALKAHVVNITGPLIRVLGDRHQPNVKLAILETLSRLLDKADAMLRPFLPQLQSTFVKALQETASKAVRLHAGGALARLLKIHPKPEPLVAELFKLLANSQDQALLETTFVAARALVTGCASKLTEPTIQEGFRVCEQIYNVSVENPTEMDISLTVCSGALLGELCVKTNQLGAQNIFSDLESNSTKLRVRHAKAVALQQMCQSDAPLVWSEKNSECRSALQAAFTADPLIANAALRAAAHVLISEGAAPDRELMASAVRAINHSSVDVRKVAATVIGHVFAKAPSQFGNDQLKLVVPQLVNGTKESNSAVRSGSELALVYAFSYHNGEEGYNTYYASIEGVAKKVLDEVSVALRRVVKHGDIALESIDNILTVY